MLGDEDPEYFIPWRKGHPIMLAQALLAKHILTFSYE